MMPARRSLGGGKYCPLVLVLAAACSGPTAPDRVPKDEPFNLRIGESALTTDDLRVKFDTVRSDSRCPMDALCVRAGEAVLALTLSLRGEAAVGRELETVPAKSQTSYSRFTITLVQLQPYPRSDRQIQPGDYVATFTVSAP
jgi:hypothetical protein